MQYFYVSAQTPDKLAKEANTLFKSEQYIEATPKYLQLLSLEPRSHFYNFRYGACLLFNSEKKPDALKYLKFAVSDPTIDPEAHYFLARAYHLNYYFDKAIREYEVYKSKVKDKTALKKDVDRQIQMCRNGLKLMSKVSDVIVKERRSSSYESFFRLYNLVDIGGSIIVTEEYQSKVDKKRGHKPVIHIAENAKIIFYSSYGDIDEGHKDIYYRTLNSKGEWSNPIRVSNVVNTEFDEDFPYLDPNGEYLYFSSKGHNSMGGYDVFRVRFNREKLTFGSVDNIDFAISSPDDDLFYVVDKDYKHAYFASSRQSEGGRIHVYRVLVNKFSSNVVMYAGNFISTVDPNNKSANVTIKDKATGRIIDNLKSNASNGNLAFSLPRGGSYEFIVQTDKTRIPQTIAFDAPFLDKSQLLRLNFLEEQVGMGTNIRVVLDINYQFTDEERSDILAALFLAKSELQPNDGLIDLLDSSPSTDNSDVLNELNLGKYNPNELSQIAERDLNRFKDNFKRNDELKQVLLFQAFEAVEKAQSLENRIHELIALSEDRGLMEKEIQELKKLNHERNNLLQDAKTALDNANKLSENTLLIQADIAKADAILQKMKTIETKSDLTKLNYLTPDERIYVSEKFNRVPLFDPSQSLGIVNANNRIQEINRSFNELDQLLARIEDNQNALSQLQVELQNAKKKDKPAAQSRIDELVMVQEALELEVKTRSQYRERLVSERDSLMNTVQVYQKTQSINRELVTNNNNARLINAKLNAELAKKIDQATQKVITNNVVPAPEVIAQLEQLENPAVDLLDSMQKEKINQIGLVLSSITKEIQRLENALSRVPSEDNIARLKLEQEKLEYIEAQMAQYRILSGIETEKTSAERQLRSLELQASVSENKIAELMSSLDLAEEQTPGSTNVVRNTADERSTDAGQTQITQDRGTNVGSQTQQRSTALNEIQRLEAETRRLENELSRVPSEDNIARLKLEQEKLEYIEAQMAQYRILSGIETEKTSAERQLRALEVQASVSENKIAELMSSLDLAEEQTPGSTNVVRNTADERSTDAGQTQITQDRGTNVGSQTQQRSTALNEIQRLEAETRRLENELSRVPSEDNIARLKLEQEKLEYIEAQMAQYRILSGIETEKTSAERQLRALELQVSVSENKIAELMSSLDLAEEQTPGSTNVVRNTADERSTDAGQTQITQDRGTNVGSQTQNTINADQRIVQTRTVITLGERTPEIQKFSNEIVELRTESELLQSRIQMSGSRAETNKILKEKERVDKALIQSQINLMQAEREQYEPVTQELVHSSSFEEDASISAEILILQQRKLDAETFIDRMSKESQVNQIRLFEEVMSQREAFLLQLDKLESQIALQNEIKRLSDETGLDPKVLKDPNSLAFALVQIDAEIEKTKVRVENLEQKKNSAKKSDQLIIEREIVQLNDHLSSLESLNTELKKLNSQVNQTSFKAADAPKINSEVNPAVLSGLGTDAINEIIGESEFLELRNEIVRFNELQIQFQNLVNQQVLLRNDMQSIIVQIQETQDQSKRKILRGQIDVLSAEYQLITNEIDTKAQELTRSKERIVVSPLYNKNPVLYHTLSLSAEVQELLAQSALKTPSNVVSPTIEGMTAGIKFIPESKPVNSENSGLNPVLIPGMIYKVQIGAFNRPVDLSRFGGFEPVTTDQVGNNIIRYSAGLFYTKNQAFQALGPIRSMGYSDAFVVAYCDGVRYTIAEADELLRQGKCSLNENADLQAETPIASLSPTKTDLTYHTGPNAAPAMPIEAAPGLFFAVQIGVFNTPISHERLQNLAPLNTHKTERNQIRYSVGRFDAVEDAIRQRDAVRPLGFSDAFVVAYFNGERITIAEARRMLETQGTEVLYSNRVKNEAPSIGALKSHVVQMASDSSAKIDQLSRFPLTKRWVSTQTYGSLPIYEIRDMRSNGIWAYYDERSGRIMTSSIDNVNSVPSGFEIQYVYQGFGVQDKNRVTLNTLVDFDASITYYQIEINWDGKMPRMFAYYLEQNFSEYLTTWNPDKGSLRFMPLTFLQKEQLKKAFTNFGELQVVETILTF
jgi:hypothetical protein